MWGRKESSGVIVILPGEMGMSNTVKQVRLLGDLMSWLPGIRPRECRGRVTHVDFSDQDVVVVNDLLDSLYRMGVRDVVIGATENANLYSILGIPGITCQSISLSTRLYL